MSGHSVERVAEAVLYEGYVLYPYRQDAMKNRVRWTLGGVYPLAYAAEHPDQPDLVRTEVLVTEATADCRLDVSVRFLHLVEVADGGESRQEATERRLDFPHRHLQALVGAASTQAFELPAAAQGARTWRRLAGLVRIAASRLGPGVHSVSVELQNTTPVEAQIPRNHALLSSFACAHVVLRIEDAEFVSPSDPPSQLAGAAAACRNSGLWPSLAGEPGSRDTVLASPIILGDYPEIAEESAGELFDSTEIDELLALRILTLSDAEKSALRTGDARVRQLLERTEALTADDMLRMHGVIRSRRVLEGRG